MSYDLILVGGTGQRFGTVLGWFLLLGLAKPPRQVLVIDAESVDDSSTAKGLQPLLNWFVQENNYHKYEPYQTTQNPKVASQFQTQTNPRLKEIWDLCFTEEESELDISHGFMANPKIGATIFSHVMESKESNPISKFLEQCGGQRMPILLVGSVAGGTGAGLIYALARHCKSVIREETYLLGMIYTNYLKIPENDKVNNAQLDQNSRCGIDFLWKKWVQEEPLHYPFDLLTILGPPAGTSLVSASSQVHPYPGFLLGVYQIADGCTQWSAKVDTAKKSQANSRPGIYLASVRGEDAIYVRGVDIKLMHKNNQVNIDDLKAYLKNIVEELDKSKNFAWKDAGESLVVQWKVPGSVYKTVSSAKHGKFSKSYYQELYNIFLQKIDEFKKYLIQNPEFSFQRWLQDLQNNGLSYQSELQSPRIKNQEWQKCIQPHTDLTVQKIAESWVMEVIHGQVNASSPPPPTETPKNPRWAFPYNYNKSGASFDLHGQTRDENFIPKILTEGLKPSGSNFPTPLGRLEYVSREIEKQYMQSPDLRGKVWKQVELLWYATALGWTQIKIMDLQEVQSTTLEKIIFKLSDQKNRYFPLIQSKSSTLLGSWDPRCGFWPSVLAEDESLPVSQELKKYDKALQHNKQLLICGTAVIECWIQHVEDFLQHASSPLWLSVAKQIIQDKKSSFSYQDNQNYEKEFQSIEKNISTRGPFTLYGVPSLEYAYFYTYEYLRNIRTLAFHQHLQNALTKKVKHKIIYYKLYNKSEIYLGSIKHEPVVQNNIELSIRKGCLDLEIEDGLILGTRSSSLDKIERMISQDMNPVINILVSKLSKIQKPDILWNLKEQ